MISEKERTEKLGQMFRDWRLEQCRQRQRFKKGPLTQEFVAAALSMSQSYLSKIESGAIAVNFLDAERLGYFYRRSLNKLSTISKEEIELLDHNNFGRSRM